MSGDGGKRFNPPLDMLGDPLDRLCVEGRKRTPRESARNLSIPFIPPLLALLVLWLAVEDDLFWTTAFWSFIYLVPPMGKESAFPVGSGSVTQPLFSSRSARIRRGPTL